MPTLKPLPDVEGPKLECFADNLVDRHVKFIMQGSRGGTASVYKVEIDGKTYALKCFYPYFDDKPMNCQLDPIYDLGEEVDLPDSEVDALVPYAAPFNNECRAFGRLKEVNREHLAVRAYGYTRLFLTEDMEAQLRSICRSTWYPTCKSWGLADSSQPIMAIVKDWVGDGETGSVWSRRAEEAKFFPSIRRNLLALHKSGIVVRDLEAQQYVNGVLVDLGDAWTIPHMYDPEFGRFPCWTFASLAVWDLTRFTHMVMAWNDIEWPQDMRPRPKPSFEHTQDEGRFDCLRPRVHRQRPFLPVLNTDGSDDYVMPEFPPYDPALFDWRKAAKMAARKPRAPINRKALDAPRTTKPARKQRAATKRKKARRN
ncbi:hypothetical protein AK830_g1672 [Neonectria ditissima]|uniref:Protein kinase domain-containing protein n=1 Tax=Neonectria ditissima TaxID=78410 RepID=A0A0P7BMC1_9HYPO|nr:hypothetical protein AK830_g1672 [Neonectria ditissima]